MRRSEWDQTAGKKYFVYGAIFAPTNSLAALHAEIEKARKAAGYADTDSLKSSSNSRPKGITLENHRELKNTVMKIARETGAAVSRMHMRRSRG